MCRLIFNDVILTSFLQDGRLLLDNTTYLCVQSKPGYEALREGIYLHSPSCMEGPINISTGSDVVLGHVTGGRGPIPPEQRIVRLKHSPGSGVLSVSVVSDGPTRILRITDENKKVSILSNFFHSLSESNFLERTIKYTTYM